MMMMRAFLHLFNKHEASTVMCSGHDRKQEILCQEENMKFQEHTLGYAGFPDQNQEDADLRKGQGNR